MLSLYDDTAVGISKSLNSIVILLYIYILIYIYFILSSTEIIKFTRKAKARGLNGFVSIIIIEDC